MSGQLLVVSAIEDFFQNSKRLCCQKDIRKFQTPTNLFFGHFFEN